MSKDVLKISEDRTRGYYIAWYCDGEEGAIIGNFNRCSIDDSDESDDITRTEEVARNDENAYFWAEKASTFGKASVTPGQPSKR